VTRRSLLLSVAAVHVALAAIVLVGRLPSGSAFAQALSPNGPAAFWSGIAILAGAIALLAVAFGWRRVHQAAAAAVAMVGGVTLLAYLVAPLAGWSVFRVAPTSGPFPMGTPFAARMAPNAALSFLCYGIALAGIARPRWRPGMACVFAGLTLVCAGLGAFAYGLDLDTRDALWLYGYLSLPVATALVTGALAVLAAAGSRGGAAGAADPWIYPISAAAFASVAVLIAVVIVSNAQRQHAGDSLRASFEIKAGVDRFIGAMARADTATRNFSLTGDDRFAARVPVHRQAVLAALDDMDRLDPANTQLHRSISELRVLAAKNFAEKDHEMAVRRREGVAGAAETLRHEPPKLMADLHAATDFLLRTQEALLRERQESARSNEVRLHAALIAGAGLSGLLLIGAFLLIERGRRRLQEANDRLETRVLERTRDLQFLADTMPQLVFTTDAAGGAFAMNARWQNYLGPSAAADPCQAVLSSTHPDDLAENHAKWTVALREQRTVEGRVRYRGVDGTYRWHLWRAVPQKNDQNVVVRWVGTATEIDDIKQAEETLEQRVRERTAELAASRERLQLIADNLPVLVAYIDREERYRFANRTYQQWFKVDPAALVGKKISEVLGPDGERAVRPHLDRAFRGERVIFERHAREGGVNRFVRAEYVPDISAAGEVIGLYVVGSDLSARHRAEEALARGRDEALAASRAKSAFLAVMSHEVRTPMNGIIGLATLLRDSPMPPEQHELARIIVECADNLLAMLNDILDFSKMEAAAVQLETVSFELHQVIESALANFRGRAREKKLALAFAPPPLAFEHLEGDPRRIRQVLSNLIGNALKFTDHGEVRVEVEENGSDATCADFRVSVVDTGIGISSGAQKRLFSPFVQLEEAADRRAGGTGLGLAICGQLVALMGGEIGVESTIGAGSRFWFRLRLPRSAALPAPGAAMTMGGAVLIVDDNEDDCLLLLRELGKLKVEAHAVSNREAAIARLKEHLGRGGRWKAVFIDRYLRQFSGLDLARSLRADPALKMLPLVLMSGGMLTDAAHIAAIGFETFLPKPITADVLAPCLARIAESPAPLPGASAVSASDVSLTVLVADDNEANRAVASAMLKSLGHTVFTANDGAVALQLLAQRTFDAVLMDCQMPEMDGFEATRQIRSGRLAHVRADIPIIGVTALALINDRQKCLAAGMSDYLTKPLRASALQAILRANASPSEIAAAPANDAKGTASGPTLL